MKTNLGKTSKIPKTTELLRLELEKCQREFNECQQRVKQMEGVVARMVDAIVNSKPVSNRGSDALPAVEKQVLEMIAKGKFINIFCGTLILWTQKSRFVLVA